MNELQRKCNYVGKFDNATSILFFLKFALYAKKQYLCNPMEEKQFYLDSIYGERLMISVNADQTELADNIRVTRVLLSCFADMYS